MSRWLSALLAWCFVFLIVIDYTTAKPARKRSRAVYKLQIVMLLITVIAFAFSTQSTAGEPLNDGLSGQVRVQLSGDDTWYAGQVRVVEECRMVFLTKPTRDGYNALMFNGAQRLQANRAGQWHELSLAALLSVEPAKCREVGSD